MRRFLLFTALVAVAACHQREQQPAANEAAAPTEGIKGVHREFRGKAEPAPAFDGPDGKPVHLADFKGKPLLVNLWASWCAPCVKELPTIDKLARLGNVQVLAVSQDDGPHASVVAFLQAHGISTLQSYQDPKMGLSAALGPDTVLPTSIMFDADGKEVWRYVGDLDWTSPQAAKLLAEPGGAPKTG